MTRVLSYAEVEAVEEILSQRKAPKSFDLCDPNFPHQTNFIRDPAKLKALFCTRRAAKSFTGGLGLVEAMLRNPGVSCLYIALTRDSAKGIMWKDVLKVINRQFELGAKFNETALTMELPNGSICYLTGVDADEEEKNKLLGRKYQRVVCDEAASYSIDLRELVYGILKPAIADYRGDIWLCGTSGNITQGLFFDITNGNEPGWALHEWSAHDNPYVARQWQEELDEIDRERPLFKLTSLYKQWYLNQWVIDSNKLVYWYQQGRNDYKILPHYRGGEWQFVLGVDLGYRPDPSAFALVGFHENDRTLYGLESGKQLEMDVTDVANRIKWYQSRFPIFKVVIDGANKQAVMEIQKRHDIALTAADKRGKSDFIEIMNAEFVQGLIKIEAENNKELVHEWKKLVWKTIGDKICLPREEHAGLPNHISDAYLYAWRFCYQFLSKPQKPKVDLRNPKEYLRHTEKLMDEALEREIQVDKAKENEEDFWAIQDTASEAEVLTHFLKKKRGR